MNWITEVLLADELDKFCLVRVCAANECSAERASCTALGDAAAGQTGGEAPLGPITGPASCSTHPFTCTRVDELD
jgi:hypothetical protein